MPNADAIRDFYSQVIGWGFSPVDCGGCDDYNILPPDSDEPAAGICHARDSCVIQDPAGTFLVLYEV